MQLRLVTAIPTYAISAAAFLGIGAKHLLTSRSSTLAALDTAATFALTLPLPLYMHTFTEVKQIPDFCSVSVICSVCVHLRQAPPCHLPSSQLACAPPQYALRSAVHGTLFLLDRFLLARATAVPCSMCGAAISGHA